MEGTDISRGLGPLGYSCCYLQRLAPSRGCPENAPLSSTHAAWRYAALMPPSHCTLWSLVLSDIHPGMFLTRPHELAQFLHGPPCAAPVLESLESTVRSSAAWQQVGGWVDTSLIPVEIQQWLQPAGWEGTLCGSCRQSTAKFQREEKSSVCGDGLAPLSSTTLLAMVTPSLPLPAAFSAQPPQQPAELSQAPTALQSPVAVPAPPCQTPARHPRPSRPSPGLCARG